MAGIVFPSWGFVFAYMIEVLYTPVKPCPPVPVQAESFNECDDYWNFIADDMQEVSFKVAYAFVCVVFSSLIGYTILHWGFGVATERMNRRVREGAFCSLIRQEIAWFDLQSPGALVSRLADDAAQLHAYAGEPIRTLVASLSSVLVGVVVSFVYMW